MPLQRVPIQALSNRRLKVTKLKQAQQVNYLLTREANALFVKYLNNKKVIVLDRVGRFKLRDEFSREAQEVSDNHFESGWVGCYLSVHTFAPYIPCDTDSLHSK
jgi:hypothetical protein